MQCVSGVVKGVHDNVHDDEDPGGRTCVSACRYYFFLRAMLAG